ncbi:MAG: dephospho-CoA kinase [Pseudomonadota bacterium]
MIRIGLTGSIGMGKSTTARMFADEGIPVHDADACVHALYEGRAVPLIGDAFPGTIIDGKVDRGRLSKKVLGNPEAMKQLEEIIHPLVREEEQTFLDLARLDGQSIVLMDIPLLFETGAEDRVDTIVVVTADPDIQRERVLSRDGMTEDRFQSILEKQMPDAEKRKRADFLIDTGSGIEAAQQRVGEILKVLRTGQMKDR